MPGTHRRSRSTHSIAEKRRLATPLATRVALCPLGPAKLGLLISPHCCAAASWRVTGTNRGSRPRTAQRLGARLLQSG